MYMEDDEGEDWPEHMRRRGSITKSVAEPGKEKQIEQEEVGPVPETPLSRKRNKSARKQQISNKDQRRGSEKKGRDKKQ